MFQDDQTLIALCQQVHASCSGVLTNTRKPGDQATSSLLKSKPRKDRGAPCTHDVAWHALPVEVQLCKAIVRLCKAQLVSLLKALACLGRVCWYADAVEVQNTQVEHGVRLTGCGRAFERLVSPRQVLLHADAIDPAVGQLCLRHRVALVGKLLRPVHLQGTLLFTCVRRWVARAPWRWREHCVADEVARDQAGHTWSVPCMSCASETNEAVRQSSRSSTGRGVSTSSPLLSAASTSMSATFCTRTARVTANEQNARGVKSELHTHVHRDALTKSVSSSCSQMPKRPGHPSNAPVGASN